MTVQHPGASTGPEPDLAEYAVAVVQAARQWWRTSSTAGPAGGGLDHLAQAVDALEAHLSSVTEEGPWIPRTWEEVIPGDRVRLTPDGGPEATVESMAEGQWLGAGRRAVMARLEGKPTPYQFPAAGRVFIQATPQRNAVDLLVQAFGAKVLL